MKSKVAKAILRAKLLMKNQLYTQMAHDKLGTVGFKSITKAKIHQDWHENSLSGKLGQIVAFYDPNDHTIFLNKKMLANLSERKICEIFIHELLHAISNHSFMKKNDRLVLLSGLKQQIFYGQNYNCLFKSLNEGFVQHLCNKILDEKSDTYKNETLFVKTLAEIIGENTLMTAFMDNDCIFQEIIEERFGLETFIEACNLLDRQNFDGAFRLFENKKIYKQELMVSKATGNLGN